MPQACSSASLHRAFTLLELLLAMSVTCVLALSLYASMRTAFKAKDAAVNSVEPLRSVQVALDLIGRDLESALPPRGVLAQPFYGMASAQQSGTTSGAAPGTGGAIEFYIAGDGRDSAVDPTRAGGIWRINLALAAQDDGGTALVRRVTRNLLSPQEPLPEDEILCRNVQDVTFRYFDGEQWTDQWDSTALYDNLPMAVEVTVELQAGAPSNQSPLAVGGRGYRLTRTYRLACAMTLEDAETAAAGTTGGAQ